MTIVARPTRSSNLIGASIDVSPRPCTHATPTASTPWRGAPGTSGTVTVVGAGKMGLPLAAQYVSHGWNVVAVDIDPRVVESINAGRSHVLDEPEVAEAIADAHREGRLRATADAAEAAAASDVVILIVPVVLDGEGRPDRRSMDAAVDAMAPGLHAGSLVIFETTLPVGDTRDRYARRLAAATGLELDAGDDGLLVSFSPERLYSGSALRNLAAYPKLVGGIDQRSTERAAAFYDAVLDAEIVAMSSAEAAEFSKLADTTYRDVNIALANEFAAFADEVGVDVLEVIDAANSQPYSHIHQPGIGVGGHCIPVYPRFLLERRPTMDLVATSRHINDGQVDQAVAAIRERIGGLADVRVLVLGLTYRHGVNELAYSRGVAMVDRLLEAGARPLAYDPLVPASDVERLGAGAWTWGATDPSIRAVVTQTADPTFASLDWAWFPALELVVDGRNSVDREGLPLGVSRFAFGTTGRPATT